MAPHSHRAWSRSLALSISISGLAFCSCAQSPWFAPFNANSRKAYISTVDPGRVYSLAFDSSTVQDGDSVYHHFGRLNDTSIFISPGCPGWGSPYCLPTNLPEWSGTLFRNLGEGVYELGNVFGDTLRFNLALGLTDTSVFFEEPGQRFAITLESMDTLTVIGVTDSVRTFRILHTDDDGTPIPSALQMQPLRVGKVLGLIDFFQVDLFPQVLNPLEMIGNKDPDAGLHQITSAMLNDFQPGDEVQTHSYHDQAGGPPYNNYDHLGKVTFSTRTDTQDSVTYTVETEFIDLITGAFSSGGGTLGYGKHDVLWEIPFERFTDGFDQELQLGSFCGLDAWMLKRQKMQYLAYCPSGNCWANFDSNGPLPSQVDTFVVGLGLYYSYGSLIYPPPNGFSTSTWINYFKKGNIVCGTEQYVGIAENGAAAGGVQLFPNPSQGLLHLRSEKPIERVEVVDARSAVLRSIVPSPDGTVDIQGIANGIYAIRLFLADGAITVRTFVKD